VLDIGVARPSWWWVSGGGRGRLGGLGCVGCRSATCATTHPNRPRWRPPRTIAELDRAVAVVPDWPVSAPTAGWSDWPGRGTVAMLEQGWSSTTGTGSTTPAHPDAVAGWTTRLAAMTAARGPTCRAWSRAPGRDRGGLLVLDQVMARFDFDQLLVSESDILDGLVASLR